MAENSLLCALSRAQVVLGLYIVRGDNMCVPRLHFFLFSHSLVLALVLDFAALLSHTPRPSLVRSALVGEIDEEADAELALDEIVAEPLKPVVH